MRRVEALKASPPNSWVAFASDGCTVVARGATFDETVEAVRAEGIEDVVLVRVPPSWDTMVTSAGPEGFLTIEDAEGEEDE